MDNGSNAKDASRIKIKVFKIKAVKKIDEGTYSNDMEYWFNDMTGVVYDLELTYPVGRVQKNENNIYDMLGGTTYIISDVIDIPDFTLYN
jgi:hypothetical protein